MSPNSAPDLPSTDIESNRMHRRAMTEAQRRSPRILEVWSRYRILKTECLDDQSYGVLSPEFVAAEHVDIRALDWRVHRSEQRLAMARRCGLRNRQQTHDERAEKHGGGLVRKSRASAALPIKTTVEFGLTRA